MRVLRCIPTVLALFLLSGSLPSQDLSGRDIMELYKIQDRTGDLSADQTMTLMNSKGGKRTRELSYVMKTDEDDNRKLLIRFLSPADIKGTGFLSIEYADRDDDRWLYLPSLRKSRRIAGSDKTDQFVGSEFAYEDLESEKLNQHAYTLEGSDTVNGTPAWLITAVIDIDGGPDESGYSKRELWISKDHNLLVQAKYYDKSGAYVKKLQSKDIRQVPGSEKWRAYEMSMEDIRTGDKTVIEVSEYRIDQNIPDEYFSERYLKRGR